jgi:hypothetical protein
MKLRFWAAFVVSVVLAVPATAHHAFNVFYDDTRTISIEGVVTSFRLVSPHSEMLVDVTDAAGNVVSWRILARTSSTNLVRQGLRAETFIGKKLKIEGNPTRREGGTAMTAGTLTFEDGKVVCFGGCDDASPSAY